MGLEAKLKQTTHQRFIIEAWKVKEFVEEKTGISDFNYKLAIYEIGLNYLENIYPKDSPM